jgi:hypothetical protein
MTGPVRTLDKTKVDINRGATTHGRSGKQRVLQALFWPSGGQRRQAVVEEEERGMHGK